MQPLFINLLNMVITFFIKPCAILIQLWYSMHSLPVEYLFAYAMLNSFSLNWLRGLKCTFM